MEIVNYDEYTSGMQKSVEDKLFFLNYVNDFDTILDYGCADGYLLGELDRRVKGTYNLIGYDVNPEMIAIAEKKTQNGYFDSSFCKCKNSIKGKTLLNLSSVIHEVYSYSAPQEVELFWHQVFNSGFDYISIRDLCIGMKSVRSSNDSDYKKVIEKADRKYLIDYENTWGSVRENKSMLHYLLKYRYKSNWDREVKENYLPIMLEELLSKIPTSAYEIVYFNHYILPFTKEKVQEDFGIELTDSTHIQILLRKK